MIKKIAIVALILAFATFTALAASAQTQTDTNCTTSPDYGTGRTTNCTSTTAAPVQPPDSILQTLQKQREARRAAQQTARQAVAAQPPQTDEQAVTNIRWCQQNPHTDVALQGIGVRSCQSVLEWFGKNCPPGSTQKLCTSVVADQASARSPSSQSPFTLTTGNDLYLLLDVKGENQGAGFAFAVGYVHAVGDLLCSANQIRCAATTDNQLRAIVTKFLTNNPEVLDRPVLPLVIRSLSEALPPDAAKTAPLGQPK
jgi:hypothetical protein